MSVTSRQSCCLLQKDNYLKWPECIRACSCQEPRWLIPTRRWWLSYVNIIGPYVTVCFIRAGVCVHCRRLPLICRRWPGKVEETQLQVRPCSFNFTPSLFIEIDLLSRCRGIAPQNSNLHGVAGNKDMHAPAPSGHHRRRPGSFWVGWLNIYIQAVFFLPNGLNYSHNKGIFQR